MIIKLCFILEIVFIAQSTSFTLKSNFGSLADEINQAAFRSGLGPIAEVGEMGPSAEEVEEGDYMTDASRFPQFDMKNAKSIQDIKSMKELKDIQEITAMKEIKSIQEIPDEIAEQFISDHHLNPIDSLDDEPEEPEDYLESSEELDVTGEEFIEDIEDSPEVDSPEIQIDPWVESSEGGPGCGEMKETLSQLKSLAGDMMDIITSMGSSEASHPEERDQPIDSEENESENEDESNGFPEGEDIVDIQEVKNLEEVKSITPIKSIQEVVGIYPLTEELAQKLRDINAGRRRHRHRH